MSYKHKINELIINSKSKLDSSEVLALRGDYNTASAILVTAFEERVKALVIQLLDFGLPIVNDLSELEYVFNQHDSRHYIGFFIDCLFEILEDLLPVIQRMGNDKEFKLRIVKIDLTNEMYSSIITWLKKKSLSFIEKVDFYQNIEKKRQQGLYYDVLKNTHSSEIIKEEYNFIKLRLNSVHILSDELLKVKLEKQQDFIKTLEETKNELIIKNTPSYITKYIQFVRKKRSKGFNKIRSILFNFNRTL